MKKLQIVFAIAAFVVLLVFPRLFNALALRNADINAKWGAVEVLLLRRNDLMRDLVNTVRGAVIGQQTTLDDLNALRSQWSTANTIKDKVRVANRMDSVLSRLLRVVEKYPDFKNNGTFLKIIDELSSMENYIAVERMRYTEAVREYNIKIRSLPASIVANLFGYKLAVEYSGVEEDKVKVIPEAGF